ASLDGLDQVDQVLAPLGLVGVARVLVLFADRLDEADGLELALGGRSAGLPQELGLVAKVIPSRSRAGGKAGEVVKRLVMELEQLIRAVWIGVAGQVIRIRARRSRAVRVILAFGIPGGIVPPARIPGPIDVR